MEKPIEDRITAELQDVGDAESKTLNYKSWHEDPTGWSRLSKACKYIVGQTISDRLIKQWLIYREIDWQQIAIIDLAPDLYCFVDEDLEESWRRFYAR